MYNRCRESIWDRIKDKKLMKVYMLFKVVNGEHVPKNMMLASYNFDVNKNKNPKNRFHTANDFSALGLSINDLIYYKNTDHKHEILLKELGEEDKYFAVVMDNGKVKFEGKLMSLSQATSIIKTRQREIINKNFSDTGEGYKGKLSANLIFP